MFYVAVDLGTYLCRFVVVKKSSSGFNIVDSAISVVNFGVVKPDGMIKNSSIKNVVAAFEKFKKYFKKENKIKCVATAALRFSKNSHELVDIIKKKYNIDIEIISALQEMEYSAKACYKFIKNEAIIIDVGSGSTEISLVKIKDNNFEIADFASLTLGLANNLDKKSIRNEELEKLTQFAKYKNVQVIFAKCGVLKVVYEYYYKKNVRKNIFPFKAKDFEDGVRLLSKNTNIELENISAIGVKKTKLVKIGLPWILKILKTINVKEFFSCDYGLKEGIILSMIEDEKKN